MKLLFLTALAVGLSTVIGALIGFALEKMPQRTHALMVGASAGIMLAAAILGLLLPAAAAPGTWTLPLVLLGAAAGASLVSSTDVLLPHLHRLTGTEHEAHASSHLSRVLLFVAAIALHKLPEGVAVGASFGTDDPADVLTVAGGITLQNIPEGMAVILPLLTAGVSRLRTFLIACGIAAVELGGMAFGLLLVSGARGAMPFILALAGGAMLYVTCDETLLEERPEGQEKAITFAVVAGFLAVLMLGKILG